jgi:hypothetical protein
VTAAHLESARDNRLGYCTALADYNLDAIVESNKHYDGDLLEKFYFSKQRKVQEPHSE